MSLLRRPRHCAGAIALAVPLALLAPAPGTAAPAPSASATFDRINVDTAVQGASFTVAGEVFSGEQNIVTSGFGVLGAQGLPTGGGTLQVYRPRANLADWRKVSVFDASANIIFPNQPTLSDVDDDGDNDLIVPSGNFFDSFAGNNRGALTWWENAGLAADGTPNPFVRHDVITGQPWSYHGVQHRDLDGDGIKDLVSVAEQGGNPGVQTDDQVETHFFRGNADLSFAAPVALADVGGSLPVVHDVDTDGDLDIITSQYFDVGAGPADAGRATFLWLEHADDGTPGLTSSDFTARTIATLSDTAAGGRGVGMGFQIRPVPGFRGPGTLSWIGTNHTNRCRQGYLPPEQVLEFLPPADPRQQWQLKTLSNPTNPTPPAADCPAGYNDGTIPIFPGDEITSRPIYGQGAPGVFGYGDIDGDGDIDLAVSGDGDRRLFWIEQLAGGATKLHTLTSPGEEFGQSGGGVVSDLNDDGVAELVFSSFDRNTVAIWKRRPHTAPPTTPVPPVTSTTVKSSLKVTPASTRGAKARKTTWKVRLSGARGGAARQVKVTFVPTRGKAQVLRTIRLKSRTATSWQGVLTWRPRESGRLRFDYAGTRVSKTLRDTSDRAQVRVRVTRR